MGEIAGNYKINYRKGERTMLPIPILVGAQRVCGVYGGYGSVSKLKNTTLKAPKLKNTTLKGAELKKTSLYSDIELKNLSSCEPEGD